MCREANQGDGPPSFKFSAILPLNTSSNLLSLCPVSTVSEHFPRLSLSSFDHPSVLTPTALPPSSIDTQHHESFLMHFVSHADSVYLVQYLLSVSVTFYSKLYTSVHSSVLGSFREHLQQGAKCVNAPYAFYRCLKKCVRMLSCACWWPLRVLVQFIDLAARPYKTVTAQSVTLAATSLTHCVSAGGKKTPVQYGVTHTGTVHVGICVHLKSMEVCVYMSVWRLRCVFSSLSMRIHLWSLGSNNWLHAGGWSKGE